MTPHEVVEAADTVAQYFGPDIAHEVCCIYLAKRPVFTTAPIHWWRRTARYVRGDARAKKTVRRAPRYRTEMSMIQRRVLTPEQTAACRELIDRVPEDITRELVNLEGVRGNHTVERTRQQVLRRQAMRYARLAVLCLVAFGMATPAWAVGPVLQTCTFSWGQPTVNSDGTPLTDLASFNIYSSPTAGGAGVMLGGISAPSPTPVPNAVYTFVCPANTPTGQNYGTVAAVNSVGQISARSNEFPFVLGSLSIAPGAPTGLTVTAIPVVLPATLSAVPASMSSAGGTTVVTVSNAPNALGNFVTLAIAGDSLGNFITWAYLDGSQTPPAVPITGASFSLAIPNRSPGAYELRLFTGGAFNLVTTTPFQIN